MTSDRHQLTEELLLGLIAGLPVCLDSLLQWLREHDVGREVELDAKEGVV